MTQDERETLPPPPPPAVQVVAGAPVPEYDPEAWFRQHAARRRDAIACCARRLEEDLVREGAHLPPNRLVAIRGALHHGAAAAFDEGAAPEADLRTAVGLLMSSVQGLRTEMALVLDRVRKDEEQHAEMRGQLDELRRGFEMKKRRIAELERRVDELNEVAAVRGERIAELEDENRDRALRIEELERELTKERAEVARLRARLDAA